MLWFDTLCHPCLPLVAATPRCVLFNASIFLRSVFGPFSRRIWCCVALPSKSYRSEYKIGENWKIIENGNQITGPHQRVCVKAYPASMTVSDVF